MPYRSKSQQRFMHARHPKIAARWDKETSKAQFKRMPDKVKRKR